jgi:hypothetical protein
MPLPPSSDEPPALPLGDFPMSASDDDFAGGVPASDDDLAIGVPADDDEYAHLRHALPDPDFLTHAGTIAYYMDEYEPQYWPSLFAGLANDKPSGHPVVQYLEQHPGPYTHEDLFAVLARSSLEDIACVGW